VKRFRGGLVFKAHRLVYHSTLGLRVIKKKKKSREREFPAFKGFPVMVTTSAEFKVYRGASLIRNTHPPRITIGP